MILDREAFLAAATALPTVDVPVPELGEGASVRLRVMNGEGRDKWEMALSKRQDNQFAGLRALLVSLCCISEDGQPLFSEADVQTLAASNGIVIDRLYDKAWEMNKLGSSAAEDYAKN